MSIFIFDECANSLNTASRTRVVFPKESKNSFYAGKISHFINYSPMNGLVKFVKPISGESVRETVAASSPYVFLSLAAPFAKREDFLFPLLRSVKNVRIVFVFFFVNDSGSPFRNNTRSRTVRSTRSK